MKKTFILAVAMLLISVAASAQAYVNAGYGFGKNIIKITDTDVTAEHPINSVHIGASYNFEIIGNFGVEPGLNVAFQFKNSDVNSFMVNKERYSALNLPIEANYGIDLGSKFALKVFAGPALNFGLYDTEKVFTNGEEFSSTDHFENETSARFFLSGVAGLGVESDFGVRVKLGYNFSLTDKDLVSSSTEHQNLFTISFGYAF